MTASNAPTAKLAQTEVAYARPIKKIVTEPAKNAAKTVTARAAKTAKTEFAKQPDVQKTAEPVPMPPTKPAAAGIANPVLIPKQTAQPVLLTAVPLRPATSPNVRPHQAAIGNQKECRIAFAHRDTIPNLRQTDAAADWKKATSSASIQQSKLMVSMPIQPARPETASNSLAKALVHIASNAVATKKQAAVTINTAKQEV